jgi:hypothetical protein
MSVDLPEPEDPMMATNSPRSTTRLTPRSACTCMSPTTKIRVTFSTLSTGSGMGVSVRVSEARRRHFRLAAIGAARFADDDLIARP